MDMIPVRQLEFTQEIADIICERLADGESLRSICRDPEMPGTTAVCKWLIRIPAFAEQYARARELQADALFDENLDIADDGRNDWMLRQGTLVPNNEAVQRSRLRIDTRKWMAGKLRPKKYGDIRPEPVQEPNKQSRVVVEGALPGEFED